MWMARQGRNAAKGALAALALLSLVAAPILAADNLPCTQVESIGVAHMEQDGTITLRMRSLPPGPIAEGTLTYKPGDPKYEEIKKHLGGIAPGETKSVPPWC
jgi:hypothetical protein